MHLDNSNKTIQFDSLEECVELKNYLIKFIKDAKIEIKDHGNDPHLIINLKDLENGKKKRK